MIMHFNLRDLFILNSRLVFYKIYNLNLQTFTKYIFDILIYNFINIYLQERFCLNFKLYNYYFIYLFISKKKFVTFCKWLQKKK